MLICLFAVEDTQNRTDLKVRLKLEEFTENNYENLEMKMNNNNLEPNQKRSDKNHSNQSFI